MQRQGTEEDVAVHHQQRPPAAPPLQRWPVDVARITAQRSTGERQADQRAAPFGDHRRPRRAGHAPVQAEDEPQRQGDVRQVGAQQDGQRRPRVLRAEEPADQGVVGQGRRQTEQAQLEELAGQRVQLCGWVHQPQCQAAEGNRQQPQQQRQAQCQSQSLQQHLAQGAAIGAASGLGGEAGGAHAQEAQHAEQQHVQRAAHRHRAQLVSVGQMAHHRAVHQGYQGHGNVGEDHRRGQRPDLAVGRGMPPGIEEQAHAGLQSGRAV
ncbi:hypothetical protein D9M72_167640 [compost metagenome]